MESILICAATEKELSCWPKSGESMLCTGVGIPATFTGLYKWTYSNGMFRSTKKIINIGIAGAYPHSGLTVGDVVVGTSECYGDIGVELPNTSMGFMPLYEMDFGKVYAKPLPLFIPPFVKNSEIKVGKGVTVNTCTGTRTTGELREKMYGADFETMEGAVVADVGHQFGIPVTEIRAISNIASDRDMNPANIQKALGNLSLFLEKYNHDFFY